MQHISAGPVLRDQAGIRELGQGLACRGRRLASKARRGALANVRPAVDSQQGEKACRRAAELPEWPRKHRAPADHVVAGVERVEPVGVARQARRHV